MRISRSLVGIGLLAVLIGTVVLISIVNTFGTIPCVSGQAVPPGWTDFEQQLEDWAAEHEPELDYGDGPQVERLSLDDMEWQPWVKEMPAEEMPPLPPTVGGIAELPDEDVLAAAEVPCP